MLTDVVILADGSFPEHPVTLGILNGASKIVCCDGSTDALVKHGLEPWAIVGDMDSISPELFEKYSKRTYKDDDQESNDLTKAVKWCHKQNISDITILGATGRREDHSIGNISLLSKYTDFINVQMVTDTGIFIPFNKSFGLKTVPGQQISVFSLSSETEITSAGLKYKLERRRLTSWWEATLNEATGELVKLDFENGNVIVYLNFLPHQTHL
jgi:thiamine pyrophosphokinase